MKPKILMLLTIITYLMFLYMNPIFFGLTSAVGVIYYFMGCTRWGWTWMFDKD